MRYDYYRGLYLMVTLHPFMADFLHWHTRRTHRSTALCRACGHTAHALRPSSGEFLMAFRVECIKMEEQLLLLETPFVESVIVRGREKRLGDPQFLTKEKSVASFKICSQCCWSKHKNFFQYFRMGPDTFRYSLHNINFLEFLRIDHFLLI